MRWKPEQLAKIIEMMVKGASQKEIGKTFGVDAPAISRAISYHNLKEIRNKRKREEEQTKRFLKDWEICLLYRRARKKKKQLKILMQLNCSTRTEILKILEKGGEDLSALSENKREEEEVNNDLDWNINRCPCGDDGIDRTGGSENR